MIALGVESDARLWLWIAFICIYAIPQIRDYFYDAFDERGLLLDTLAFIGLFGMLLLIPYSIYVHKRWDLAIETFNIHF